MSGKRYAWTVPADAAARLQADGYFITSCPISGADLDAIKRELAAWGTTPAVNGYGCIFSAGDALLQNFGLYSPTALRIALSDDILDAMERIFGRPAVLAKIEYRRAVEAKTEMPLHSDGGHDISVYIYLDGVSADRGSTYVIPGTQKIGLSMNDGHLQVPDTARAKIGVAPVVVEGPPGVCLFFDTNVWHGRTATARTGREILWLSYVPGDWASERLNLVVSTDALRELSPRQITALGVGLPGSGKNGEDFRLSRRLDSSSLNLLPLSYLTRVVARRLARSAYQRFMPGAVRRGIAGALAALRPAASAYKKATAN
jgi:Phytanoyl-CoA dioxygenase (PhyH)